MFVSFYKIITNTKTLFFYMLLQLGVHISVWSGFLLVYLGFKNFNLSRAISFVCLFGLILFVFLDFNRLVFSYTRAFPGLRPGCFTNLI